MSHKREYVETKRAISFSYGGNLMELPAGRSYADTVWPHLDRATALQALHHVHAGHHRSSSTGSVTVTGYEVVPDELTAPVVAVAPDAEETIEVPEEPTHEPRHRKQKAARQKK